MCCGVVHVKVYTDNIYIWKDDTEKSLTQQPMVFSLASEGKYFSFCADDPHIPIFESHQIYIKMMHLYNTFKSSKMKIWLI